MGWCGVGGPEGITDPSKCAWLDKFEAGPDGRCTTMIADGSKCGKTEQEHIAVPLHHVANGCLDKYCGSYHWCCQCAKDRFRYGGVEAKQQTGTWIHYGESGCHRCAKKTKQATEQDAVETVVESDRKAVRITPVGAAGAFIQFTPKRPVPSSSRGLFRKARLLTTPGAVHVEGWPRSTHPLLLKNFWVTETHVSGEGSDDIGEFQIRGHACEEKVTFEASYDIEARRSILSSKAKDVWNCMAMGIGKDVLSAAELRAWLRASVETHLVKNDFNALAKICSKAMASLENLAVDDDITERHFMQACSSCADIPDTVGSLYKPITCTGFLNMCPHTSFQYISGTWAQSKRRGELTIDKTLLASAQLGVRIERAVDLPRNEAATGSCCTVRLVFGSNHDNLATPPCRTRLKQEPNPKWTESFQLFSLPSRSVVPRKMAGVTLELRVLDQEENGILREVGTSTKDLQHFVLDALCTKGMFSLS
jgi:hypothetical protein